MFNKIDGRKQDHTGEGVGVVGAILTNFCLYFEACAQIFCAQIF
jgi:hypothetical protein